MTDWRYWITYNGRVTAATENEARVAAVEAIFTDELAFPRPTVVDFTIEPIESGEREFTA